MTRTAEGSSESFALAQELARANLCAMLEHDFDSVPCPSCDQFQPETVRRLKREYRAGYRLDGLACIALGVGVGGFLAVLAPSLAWLVGGLLILAGVGRILSRTYLAWRFDPNAPERAAVRRAFARVATPPYRTDFVAFPDGTVHDLRGLRPAPPAPKRTPYPFLILLGALLGLPGFLFSLCGIVKAGSALLRCEAGSATVVADRPPSNKVLVQVPGPFGGVPAELDLPPVLELLPRLKLQYLRQGEMHEKPLKIDFSTRDRYQVGSAVPVLFDPGTGEFFEGSKGQMAGLLAACAVGSLVAGGVVWVGWRAWRDGRRAPSASFGVRC